MFKRGKKGEDQSLIFFTILDLFLIALLIYALTDYTTRVEENTMLSKEYLSKDISLMLGSVIMSPIDLYSIQYKPEGLNFRDFNIEISENRVIASDENKNNMGYIVGLKGAGWRDPYLQVGTRLTIKTEKKHWKDNYGLFAGSVYQEQALCGEVYVQVFRPDDVL